jgi:hypothetical protein
MFRQKEEEIRQSITEVYKCSCIKTILLLFVTIIDKVTIWPVTCLAMGHSIVVTIGDEQEGDFQVDS